METVICRECGGKVDPFKQLLTDEIRKLMIKGG